MKRPHVISIELTKELLYKLLQGHVIHFEDQQLVLRIDNSITYDDVRLLTNNAEISSIKYIKQIAN